MAEPQTPESFWARVKKTDGCWEWQGATSRGYGRVIWHGKKYRAHRIAAWLSGLLENPRGASGIAASGIADNLVLHKCDNRKCCNPKHFFIGSQADNTKDAVAKNRLAKGERGGAAKLTNEQADQIRKEYAQGNRFQKDIAKDYGVSATTISWVTMGKCYKSINK